MTEQDLLTGTEIDALDAWWRAADYLSVGQIYLMGNPLLAEPLRPVHVKRGCWGTGGTTPGLNLIRPALVSPPLALTASHTFRPATSATPPAAQNQAMCRL
jgi:XFP N-terminal domain